MGEPTLSQKNRSIIDDLDDADSKVRQDQANLPRAACVLVTRDDGKVLAVSRKDDPTDFGLPGGKIDPGEDAEQAAARELEEETGLRALRLTPVFVDVDEDGYHVTTFAAHVAGKIDTDESGVVRWVDVKELLGGSFGGYNRRLLKKVGRIE